MYQYVFGTRVELDLRPTYSSATAVDPKWFQPLSAASSYRSPPSSVA